MTVSELLEKMGWSKAELARRVGTTTRSIYRWIDTQKDIDDLTGVLPIYRKKLVELSK